VTGGAHAFAVDIAERLGRLGPVVVKRMFGGAALSVHGVTFALLIDGDLYLRVDAESRPAFERLGSAPFSYQAKGRTVTVASYFAAPADILDDPDDLPAWAERALQAARAAAEAKAARRPRRTPRP
jgi:DNA transformation protein